MASNKLLNTFIEGQYEKELDENILRIEKIIKDLQLEDKLPILLYKDILSKSMQVVTNNWRTQKKYCRTLFVMKILENEYSKKNLSTSINLDAMINILDDLFDENLDLQRRKLYILEYLRIFPNFIETYNEDASREQIASYFNKLITLAMAEQSYLNQIKSTSDLDEIIKTSAELLITRAMDIDVFANLGVSGKKWSGEQLKNYRNNIRIFRALNILKKDLLDIQDDLEKNQESLVTFIYQNRSDELDKYLIGLTNLLINKVNIQKYKNSDVPERLKNEIYGEKTEIIKFLPAL